MKQWEDIVKDRLEGYESTLPEGSLAEFHALRGAKAAPAASKAVPRRWAIAAAAAAALAAVLFLRRPEVSGPEIRMVPQPAASLAGAADPAAAAAPLQTATLQTATLPTAPRLAQNVVPRTAAPRTVQPTPAPETEASAAPVPEPEQEPGTQEDAGPVCVEPAGDRHSGQSVQPVGMKPAAAVGTIAGGGLIAAVLPPLLEAGTLQAPVPGKQAINDAASFGHEYNNNTYVRITQPRHDFPLRAGISSRIPVTDRLAVTTGLTYSLYRSTFTDSQSVENTQYAHYLGIPLRLDWTFAASRWLDVYAGAGLEGDYCLGATLAGNRIAKDGFSCSLLAAGGVQFNFTRRVGLYVEPELSWTVPSEKQILQTWRTVHPLMFSANTGLRFNF